ncbi:MAG: acetoacetyl-CoA reductase, partial [Caulobacteraceae bacterium]|nr:acetoacetyl-CoA reductase [Caulobacteraceae bacterium]
MTKTAVVTGGTRGIGLAITQHLKAAGYKVAALYAGNEAAAEAVRKDLGVLCIKADVGDFEAVGAAFAEIEKTLGPIEILVNNAGITRDAMLHKLTPGQWSEVIRADLDSVFNTSRHVIDGMRDRNFGRIINISSINGQKGQMGQTNYSAAKAGVIGFTKALAQETARKGITVNVIAPGYIDTDMVAAVPEKALEGIIASIPVGRLGKAEEIAGAVLYLASEG